tara:strand:- start:1731 stop:2477 length:747 start_codon:yes stop_codon:yes gene_type:complete
LTNNELIIKRFLNDGFDLKTHLVDFLSIDAINLESFLKEAKTELASLHPGDGSLSHTDFYENIVKEKHLADLAAWHITSKEYIADTLRLQQKFAKNLVLDFGGGIGTHALANAMSSNIESVFFVDINKTNREFVEYRAAKLGVSEKISFHNSISDTKVSIFDSIICLDVLEHLSNPSTQLDVFHQLMDEKSIALFNWYFYKGDKGEYPFHVDDKEIVNKFFYSLQDKYIEIFHPILITTRAYRKKIIN